MQAFYSDKMIRKSGKDVMQKYPPVEKKVVDKGPGKEGPVQLLSESEKKGPI